MKPKRLRVQGRILCHLEKAAGLIRGGGDLALALEEIDGAIGEILVSYGNALVMKGPPIQGATTEEIARRLGITFPRPEEEPR